MEQKIQLEIVGLSYSQTQTGAYALVLGEQNGQRRLPVIIGNFEAQSIAIELENMQPSRPLTHDIFKSFAESFQISVVEVIIYNLVEGVFFAKIVCERDGERMEIDARTSDAIALAVRFKCPMFTYEFILEKAGIILDDDSEIEAGSDIDEDEVKGQKIEVSGKKSSQLNNMSIPELEEELNKAIEAEDYERASNIRDEISSRS
ncbi:bifunctional nuclease family protein [Salibacteraceae bacterium]|nr:bifunctional nuclease family protein [Salibacteraceae bacterium]